MTISVRLNDNDTKLMKAYAKMKKLTLSELIRNAVLEKIEDEYDLKRYDEALEKYNKNPKTYTLDEIEEELGLDEI